MTAVPAVSAVTSPVVAAPPLYVDPAHATCDDRTDTKATAAEIAAYEAWWREYHNREGWL